jgi:hypothetical protein
VTKTPPRKHGKNKEKLESLNRWLKNKTGQHEIELDSLTQETTSTCNSIKVDGIKKW